jgi:hypothetical protein
VDLKLFPYLKKFKTSADSPDTIEYKIGEIFKICALNFMQNVLLTGHNRFFAQRSANLKGTSRYALSVADCGCL